MNNLDYHYMTTLEICKDIEQSGYEIYKLKYSQKRKTEEWELLFISFLKSNYFKKNKKQHIDRILHHVSLYYPPKMILTSLVLNEIFIHADENQKNIIKNHDLYKPMAQIIMDYLG